VVKHNLNAVLLPLLSDVVAPRAAITIGNMVPAEWQDARYGRSCEFSWGGSHLQHQPAGDEAVCNFYGKAGRRVKE
jgi:hypothetical protein